MYSQDLLNGYTALKVKDLKNAFEFFSSVLQSENASKELYEAKVGLGLTFRELGDLEKAVTEMKRAAELSRSPSEAIYNLGMFYEEKEEYALAVQNYDLAISLDPTLLEAYNNRGIAWLKVADIEQSKRDFRNAMDQMKDQSKVLCNMGMSLLAEKKYEKAIDNFDKSLLANEMNTRSLCGKGLALYYLDRYDDSMICFDAAISTDPDFYVAHFYKGVILKRLDLLEESELAIRAAIKVRERYPLAWFELGSVLEAREELHGALEAYSKAIKYHHGTYEEALFNKGKLLYRLDRFEDALGCHKRILAKNARIPSVWTEMGRTLLRIEGMEDKVMPVLKNAFGLDPTNKEVAVLLSEELIRRNDVSKAFEVLRKVMDVSPDPLVGANLSDVLFHMRRYKECIDISELTLSLDPESYRTLLPMGRAYGKLGKTEEYKQCLRRYLRKFPSDAKIDSEMRSIG